MSSLGKRRLAETPELTEMQSLCLELISMIQYNEILWNKKHHDYKNKQAQEKAWNFIAEEMGLDKNQVKEKWFLLRASHRQYTSRQRKSTITGSNRGVTYHPKWYAFEAMSFLSTNGDDNDAELEDDKPTHAVSQNVVFVPEPPEQNKPRSKRIKLPEEEQEVAVSVTKEEQVFDKILQKLERLIEPPKPEQQPFLDYILYRMRNYSAEQKLFAEREFLDILDKIDRMDM